MRGHPGHDMVSDLTTGYIHMRHGENPDQFRVTQDKEQEMASLFAESRTLRT